MALITVPSTITLRAAWTPRPMVQVNRSAWNRARRVLDLDNGYFTASVSILPLSREVSKRDARAFYAKLRGSANTFQLPTANCDQHAGSNPTVASGGAAGATTLTMSASISLVAGQYATVPLDGGSTQLVLLTEDVSGTTMTFEPPLRLAAAAAGTIETIRPYGTVALVDQSAAPSEEEGVMTWSFEAEEAF